MGVQEAVFEADKESANDLTYDAAMHICETKFAPLIALCQAFVV